MLLDIKKAWIVLLSVPRTKALALPNPDEQTTLEPTPIELYTLPNTRTDLRSCTQKGTTLAGRILGSWYKSHPGHLPLLRLRLDCWICKIRYVSTTASSKRLQYVWTTLPPNTRFVLLCLWKTPPYLARRRPPCLSSDRTHLTGTTREQGHVVRCKDTKIFLNQSIFPIKTLWRGHTALSFKNRLDQTKMQLFDSKYPGKSVILQPKLQRF